MSNSGIDQIQVYIRRKPRSLAEHLGTGRHYNINSKRGRLHILFAETGVEHDIYNNDIAAFRENLECIRSATCPYVVIAPSYMIYAQDFNELLQTHIDSGADITLLYHSTDDAKEHFLNCNTVNLNKQKGVLSLEMNRGTAKNRQIFMDTYVMSRGALPGPHPQGSQDLLHVHPGGHRQRLLRGTGCARRVPPRILRLHHGFQELL